MIAKLKAWYKREIKKEREGLKKALEMDGHTYYVLDALPNYCVNRFFYFVAKNEEINTGVPLDYFAAIADQLDALCKDPNKLQINAPKLAEMIRFAINRQKDKWYWLTIAIIEAFVLIDDEPLNEISPEHNKIKRDLLSKNPDVRFFFTNIATQYLANLDATFKTSEFEEYWKSPKAGAYEMLESIGI